MGEEVVRGDLQGVGGKVARSTVLSFLESCSVVREIM